ncbi:TLR adapter interacting with SLC15A4 on the lysosome-like [Rhincodon typus]|uniref:TLR adapter interacting with SLC15A4 on the lysosome-like n=1 Tax=Rhincodon typus TaxID=259920 RepID=UPI00202FB7B8|nr:TLR adapter interacting with SLC15A4 on the lysosome-like [Rhincodon typus]XP_048461144.1 TLR adapter interacting with SLC15A4 on the lysosome-like [Rhincodon typus]
MLAEGFLTGIGYSHHQRECVHQDNNVNSKRIPKTRNDSWEVLFSLSEFSESIDHEQSNAEERLDSTVCEKGQSLPCQSGGQATDIDTRMPVFERKISDVLDIPKSTRCSESNLDLYQSWSPTCQSYTDLQIAGDNVTPRSPSSMCCLMVHGYESCNRPLLQLENQSGWPSIPGSGFEAWPRSGTETNLNSDRSIALLKEPLSNSVLNRYMEQKMTELYKQYLEDNMIKCASPTKIMGSHFLMTNIDQISLQISHDNNMEPTKAKDIVLNCLLSVACATNSSDICTPNLQISSQ